MGGSRRGHSLVVELQGGWMVELRSEEGVLLIRVSVASAV
jgi:hypothetical protein